MAGLDELRKLKGYEPIFFLPFLADVLLPDTEAQARRVCIISEGNLCLN